MICGRCGGSFDERPALSRADGKTKICPGCGTREAIESLQLARRNESRAAVREYLLSKLQAPEPQEGGE